MAKRIAFRILIIVALAVVGIVYLIRSCLSGFDERASIGGGGSSSQAASQFLVFEKDGKGIIFSMVQYDRTTSYSQKGGVTTRSIRRTYYAQANDLFTAEKINTAKIKSGSSIKSYPVELMGAGGNKAWLFAGELMAYDPFTLEKVADASIIEEKNPALKGKLINERKYYEFDPESQHVTITAADGARYALNTSSLLVQALSDEPAKDERERAFIALEKKINSLRTAHAKTYDRLRYHNQQYQQKRMPVKQYLDSSNAIKNEVALLDKERDSLEQITRKLAIEINKKEKDKDRKRNVRRNGSGYTGMKMNSDTLLGQWYGLFTAEDLQKETSRFDHRTSYDETDRNKLYKGLITQKDDYWMIGEEKTLLGNGTYLHGGFLVNKETGLPFHLGQDFLIVHKDKIGTEGIVQLTRVTQEGKQVWTLNTGLKEFYDWQQKGDRLLVAGTDNKNLSSGEVNLLQVIDLRNAGVVAYDFFDDKPRK